MLDQQKEDGYNKILFKLVEAHCGELNGQDLSLDRLLEHVV
jgi:hypothetical protein